MSFDPATYPGPRPDGPVLVQGGRTWPLMVDGDTSRPWRRLDGGPVPPPDRLRLSVAYGANAAPQRLTDKGLDVRGAVLVPARMVGWVPAFEARRTGYGAVPLTLVPARDPEHVADTWVLGVHAEDLDALDRSEGRAADPEEAGGVPGDDERTAPAGSYVLARVGPVAVGARFLLPDALAYRPGPRTRLLHGAEGPLTWPRHDQAGARAALDAAGGERPAPAPTGVRTGPWPSTPLLDLPLFVYGTLRPAGAAWSLVADLVDVGGPATAAARLYDTGYGYPALDLDTDGEVAGVLLRPRSADVAAELVARVDRYEGAPELFRRAALRVRREDGSRCWAIAYGWATGVPPGAWRPDGRW